MSSWERCNILTFYIYICVYSCRNSNYLNCLFVCVVCPSCLTYLSYLSLLYFLSMSFSCLSLLTCTSLLSNLSFCFFHAKFYLSLLWWRSAFKYYFIQHFSYIKNLVWYLIVPLSDDFKVNIVKKKNKQSMVISDFCWI